MPTFSISRAVFYTCNGLHFKQTTQVCTVGRFTIFIDRFTIGSVTSYQLQSCLSILPPILFFLLMMFIPESPKYLVENGKTGEAIKSLMWFRMAETPELVKNELKKVNKQE